MMGRGVIEIATHPSGVRNDQLNKEEIKLEKSNSNRLEF